MDKQTIVDINTTNDINTINTMNDDEKQHTDDVIVQQQPKTKFNDKNHLNEPIVMKKTATDI